jgi:hypothetical protein
MVIILATLKQDPKIPSSALIPLMPRNKKAPAPRFLFKCPN